MNPKWLNFTGLMFALAGALTLALGLIISRKQALKIAVSRLAEDSDDQNICLPQVRNEMRVSRFALIGVVLLGLGFLLQIIGNWLAL